MSDQTINRRLPCHPLDGMPGWWPDPVHGIVFRIEHAKTGAGPYEKHVYGQFSPYVDHPVEPLWHRALKKYMEPYDMPLPRRFASTYLDLSGKDVRFAFPTVKALVTWTPHGLRRLLAEKGYVLRTVESDTIRHAGDGVNTIYSWKHPSTRIIGETQLWKTGTTS